MSQLLTVPAGTPKTGWRAWSLVLSGGSPRLAGLSPTPLAGVTTFDGAQPMGKLWTPGTNTTVAPESAHTAAGFFIAQAQGNVAMYGRATGAWGRANGWGQVADQGDCWLAELASIVEIFIPGRHAPYAAALASFYGVPVSQA
jgi:hypothetical protein